MQKIERMLHYICEHGKKMSFLYFLEDIRNPVCDFIFKYVTVLGEQTAFIALVLLTFWCVSKKTGYGMMLVGFLGTIINQTLKLLFRIPRPWVKDPDFTIVESARAAATGYSFPSGHTQNSVGVFGSLFSRVKNKWVKAVSILLCILVPFSRMYLGVHTPADVIVSIVVATLLILVIYPLVDRIYDTRYGMYIAAASFILLSVGFLAYVTLFPFPSDTDPHNYESGLKNACMMMGVALAFPTVYFIDSKLCKFETKAPLPVQIVKFVLGLVIALSLLEGLKLVFPSKGDLYYLFRSIRYFTVFVIAGGLYPFAFKPMTKLYQRIAGKKG